MQEDLRLAFAHYQMGRFDEAERICRDLLALEPSPPDAWHLLGAIAQRQGKRERAAELIAEAAKRAPESAQILNSFGIAQRELGQLTAAEQSFRRAAALKPGYADAHNNLGNALRELDQLEMSERSLRKALALKPDYAEAHGNLGITLRGLGQMEKAERSLRRALALKPDYAEAHVNLGATLFAVGRLEEAERCYRHALALEPSLALAQSGLIFLLNYVSGRAPSEIYAEHRNFTRRYVPFADPRPHRNTRGPERRLRIGYVSGDLRHHPVGFFIEPVLARHDATKFEIFCYHNSPRSDAVTERVKTMGVKWRVVFKSDDDTVENLVREDAIDILVDLSGHTVNNRLTLFARKPAPIQVTWLGYLNTTAVDAIDYRITDGKASPEGLLEAYHSEKLVRLPNSQWCYQPPHTCPDVEPAPCFKTGHITFAAFGNPAKIGAPVIELWSRLLKRVPGSRLLIVANGLTDIPAEYAARFTSRGIARASLQLLGNRPFQEYLALHHLADVGLDTFPFTGGTTTCHALWMGLPVVSLAGNTAPSRGGASLLHAIGLGSMVAQTPDEYVDIAAALAGDLDRLGELRTGMRERIRRSPLMDAEKFTRNLEAMYRGMWHTWCAETPDRNLFGSMAAYLRHLLLPKE